MSDREYWYRHRENARNAMDVAEQQLGIELTPDRILANLKLHIELFYPEDIEAGIWAYEAIAKVLASETHKAA